MLAIKIIFAVFAYLAAGFITYTFGMMLGALGIKKATSEELETRELHFSYKANKFVFKHKELSYPLKALQFVGWPIVLPYLIIFILIRLSELSFYKIQNDAIDRAKTESTIRFINNWKERCNNEESI